MSAPLLQQTSPADNLSGVAATANLVLTFNQTVRLGTSGTIRIYESDGTLFHTISVTDASQVSLEGGRRPTKVTVNPNVDLDPGTGYYVLIDAGAIENRTGEDFAGLSSPTAFNFTTAGTPPVGDTTAPTLISTSPLDNATDVVPAANLVLTFNEAIKAGTGNIEIHNGDGSIAKTIDITDESQISFSGNQLTINPSTDLAPSTGYYVTLASGVVRDLANNNFAGISSSTAFNFTTALPDTTAPVLVGTSPADDAVDVLPSADLVFTFDEPVKLYVGTVVVYKDHGGMSGELVEIVATYQTDRLTVSGNQLTVNPIADLDPGASYYITISSSIVRDLSNNNFVGSFSPTAFNFTTASGPEPFTLPASGAYTT